MPLYAALPPAAQAEALEPAPPGVCKVGAESTGGGRRIRNHILRWISGGVRRLWLCLCMLRYIRQRWSQRLLACARWGLRIPGGGAI
jgi:hypothetical protein